MTKRLMGEGKRIIHAKVTWLFMMLFLVTPLLVTTNLFGLVPRSYDTTLTNLFILNPAKLTLYVNGFGAMLYTLFMLRETYGSRSYAIMESTGNPIKELFLQTVVILIIALFTSMIGVLLTLPYIWLKMDVIFDLLKSIKVWGYLYLGGLFVVTLLTAGIYLFLRSFEVSLLLTSALMLFSMMQDRYAYYVTVWLQTAVTHLSDGTENYVHLKYILYGRLFGILIALGIYTLGLLSTRRYGKSLRASFVKNLRYVALPIIMVFMITVSAVYLENDPLITDYVALTDEKFYQVNSHTNSVEIDMATATEGGHQNSEYINTKVSWSDMKAEVIAKKNKLHGKSIYLLEYAVEEEQDITIEIPVGFEVTKVMLENKEISFEKDDFSFVNMNFFHFSLPAGEKKLSLEFHYEGTPKGNKNGDINNMQEISEDYIEMYSSRIFPELKVAAQDIKTYAITIPAHLDVFISGGKQKVIESKEGYVTYEVALDRIKWQWDFSLYAGNYITEKRNIAGQEVQFAFFENKKELVKRNEIPELMEDIYTYYVKLYGSLPLNGKPLIFMETKSNYAEEETFVLRNLCAIPESILTGNMSKERLGTGEIKEDDAFMKLVETIAHNWWAFKGYGAVTQTEEMLEEAATQYSIYLYYKERFGDVYANEHVKALIHQKANITKNDFYTTFQKEYITKLPIKDVLKFYYPGQIGRFDGYTEAMKLFRMAELIGGDEALTQILREEYLKCRGGEEAWALDPGNATNFASIIGESGVKKEEVEAW